MSYDNPSTADHRKSASIIKNSGLFDAQYYVKTYPETQASNMYPLDHFIRHGASAGLNPNEKFNTVFYLAENSHIYSKGINPLVHYIEYGRPDNVPVTAINEVQTFDAFDRALRSGMFTASPTAEKIESVSFAISSGRASSSASDLPPIELMERVGSPNSEHFETAGQVGASTIRRLLPSFSFENKRCMDFGCGAGRMIRHFTAEAESSEFWGCDIDATSIYWLSENLTPPFHFFQLGDAPILPFEDNSFDLICAIGVFCQVYRDWQLWALELRRILKPGGQLVMTYNGQTVFERTFPHQDSYESFMADRGMYVMKPYLSWNQGGPQVIHSLDWVQRMWGSYFDIDYIACNGFMDYQDICMMRKPTEIRRKADRAVPIYRLGTSQRFHAKAIGSLDEHFDPNLPFLESYGIESHGGSIELTGWIAFEHDEPAEAKLFLDDESIACEASFERGEPLKNWNATKYSFTVRGRTGDLSLGRCMAKLHLKGKGGTAHVLQMPARLN